MTKRAVLALLMAVSVGASGAAELPDIAAGTPFATKGKWEVTRLGEGCAAVYHFSPKAELWLFGPSPDTMMAGIAFPSDGMSADGAKFSMMLEGSKFDNLALLGSAHGQSVVGLMAGPEFFEKLRYTRMLKVIENGYLRVGMQLYQQLSALDELGACLTR